MKNIVLSLALLFSGISIFGAASDDADSKKSLTQRRIEVIEKIRRAPIVLPLIGRQAYNEYLEGKFDAIKALLIASRVEEAEKKISALKQELNSYSAPLSEQIRKVRANLGPMGMVIALENGRPEDFSGNVDNEVLKKLLVKRGIINDEGVYNK